MITLPFNLFFIDFIFFASEPSEKNNCFSNFWKFRWKIHIFQIKIYHLLKLNWIRSEKINFLSDNFSEASDAINWKSIKNKITCIVTINFNHLSILLLLIRKSFILNIRKFIEGIFYKDGNQLTSKMINFPLFPFFTRGNEMKGMEKVNMKYFHC